MVRDVAEVERRSGTPSELPPLRARSRHRRRRRWIAGVLAGVLLVTAVALLVDDEVHQHQQFDRAQTSLAVARHHRAVVAARLTRLRHDVHLLATQVGDDSTALDQDISQLKGAQAALLAVRADVSKQGTLITSLQTCLTGIEEALNSLSVGNQPAALGEIDAVSTSCSVAEGTGG